MLPSSGQCDLLIDQARDKGPPLKQDTEVDPTDHMAAELGRGGTVIREGGVEAGGDEEQVTFANRHCLLGTNVPGTAACLEKHCCHMAFLG